MDNFEKLIQHLKTVPRAHQLDCLRASRLARYHANFSEQGTGKTWSTIAEMFALYVLGHIDRCLVLAPKGVDANWLKRELPKHAPDPSEVTWRAALWRPQKTKKKIAEIMDVMEFDGFKILLMNWEAIRSERGNNCAMMFLGKGNSGVMIVGDESHRIKNPSAATSKAALRLARQSHYRRILTGTPSTGSPFDYWSQMMFLHPDILGINSFRAFCARYAVMADENDHVYKAIQRKIRAKLKKQFPNKPDDWLDELVKKRSPQMVQRDSEGAPIYKNLDELKDKVAQVSFRVTKAECLDLPDKIYTQTFFEITPQQTKVYNELKYRLRLLLEDETILPVIKLTAMQKMSQVCSGYFITPDDGVQRVEGPNPKMELLREHLEDLGGKQAIIWGLLRQELKDIAGICRELEVPFVEYHGGISDDEKEKAVDTFQEGDAQIFIGQQQSGGIGLTLTAAEVVYYYSNSFNLTHRIQSEDRAHRIGQESHVVYHDFIAEGTIEEEMVAALQRKDDLTKMLLGDQAKSALFL